MDCTERRNIIRTYASVKFRADTTNPLSLLRIREISESKGAGSIGCSISSNDTTASQVSSQGGNSSVFATIDSHPAYTMSSILSRNSSRTNRRS